MHDVLNNTIKIFINIRVPKSQNFNTPFIQISSAPLIPLDLRHMLAAIQFNHQLQRRTEKVRIERTDRMLPSKRIAQLA